jgi:anthranilate phosphoribosyltransferase
VGLDELTLAGANQVVVQQDEAVRSFALHAAELGLEAAPVADILGGDAAENATRLLELLNARPSSGPESRRRHGAYRDTVLLNAAAALVVAGRTDDVSAALVLARRSLESGAALEALDRLRAASEIDCE